MREWEKEGGSTMPEQVNETVATDATQTDATQTDVKDTEPTKTEDVKVEDKKHEKEAGDKVETPEQPKQEDAKSDELEQLKGQLDAKDKEIYDLSAKLKKEQGRVEEFKEKVKELTAVVESLLESKLKTIPEEYHALIPEGDLVTKLNWLNKAEETGIFTKRVIPNIEIGKPMELGDKNAKDTSKLTPQQKLSHYFSQYFYKR